MFLVMLAAHFIWAYSSLYRQREISRLMVEYEHVAVVCGERRWLVEETTPLLITAWLMILKLKLNGKIYRLTLWHDSGDAEQLRRLRVWLLCGGWRRES